MKRVLVTLFSVMLTVNFCMAQCPMCKTAVESNLKNDGAQVGLGLNDGILYLLGAPYLLIGIVAFFWYRSYKLKKNQAV